MDISDIVSTHVSPEPNTGSWLWVGSIGTCGYGKYGHGGGLAHRMVYESLAGKIQNGLQLDHVCRQRSCVNPAHLQPVTCRDNVRRGLVMHSAWNQGERHGQSKLTESEVVAARAIYSSGGVTHKELAERFGVTRRAMGDAINGVNWKHLPAGQSV